MDSLLKTEQQATRLRHHLRIAQKPELKILCGLRFFKLFSDEKYVGLESYIREFVPSLAAAARKSDTAEFLPGEAESLTAFIALLENQEAVLPDDLAVFKDLVDSITADRGMVAAILPKRGNAIYVTCLFVEYYPDIDLPPRGRLLNLQVTVSAISARADSDDVEVHNPVSEPDDRFLQQARDSIKVAREYLHNRYGLSLKKRYRFDFAVDSTGARFTGDSLGIAFAVGATVAVSEIEVFRERLAVSSEVAFSGALLADGTVAPIDTEALKLKIYRAFHSDIKHLVIPREHITEAWQYVSELEKQYHERKLELFGADTFESVATDSQLVRVERFSTPVYLARKLWSVKRSQWVEVPALLVLVAILALLLTPDRYMPWFDDNPEYLSVNLEKNRIEVYNADNQQLWNVTYSGRLHGQGKRVFPNDVYDLQGDGKNEVFYIPCTDDSSSARGWLHVYSYKGELLFRRYCPIIGEYPRDDSCTLYNTGNIGLVELQDDVVIITIVDQENPARSHYRFWNSTGDSLGWYINSGHGIFDNALDIDGDGKKELLFMVFNNRMKCSALLVLPSDSMYGVSPPYQNTDFDLSWVKRGNQLAYILFPKTDLGEIDLEGLLNSGSKEGISMESDSILKIKIIESKQGKQDATMIYYLNKQLRVFRVVRSDRFEKRRNDLVQEGRLPFVDWDDYQAQVRDAVTYWTNSGWVTEEQLRAAETSQ